jgi:hypothetical protein
MFKKEADKFARDLAGMSIYEVENDMLADSQNKDDSSPLEPVYRSLNENSMDTSVQNMDKSMMLG